MNQMQGIVSVLLLDNSETTLVKAGSLRRTLSADMSSKKWLADHNGSPLMKKISSSEQIATVDSSVSSESEEDESEHPRRVDIWTAIMSQKKQDNSGNGNPPPYVHPLVRKSASSLSEKSLKVCTESLGSETGSETPSDVFSSPGSQKIGGEQKQQEEKEEKEENKVVKHPCLTTRKAQLGRSLPPPLPSLAAAQTEGPSLQMHSRRVHGRLVLEAVSVPQQKYFEAQRQDGRFLLTLIDNPELNHPTENEFVDMFNLSEETDNNNNNNNIKNDNKDNINEYDDDNDEDEDEDEDLGILKEPPLSKTGFVINVHKSAVTTKPMTERGNENPWRSRKLDEAAPTKTKSLPTRPPRAAGLPPLPPPSAANCMNSYQYFWRAKPTVASVIDPMITQHRPPTKTKHLVLLRGNKADCSFIPSLKGCKDPRRSLVMWEPFCIAS